MNKLLGGDNMSMNDLQIELQASRKSSTMMENDYSVEHGITQVSTGDIDGESLS